jgi:hypothetical protein
MRLLTLTDFETLVDLVLSTSAWPSTGERAFVPTSAELPQYVEKTRLPYRPNVMRLPVGPGRDGRRPSNRSQARDARGVGDERWISDLAYPLEDP